MKSNLITTLALIAFVFSSASYANDKQVINQLLTDFLANKVGDDLKNHSRFWADDLIYTSSAGERFNKQFIIDGIKSSSEENNAVTVPSYHAEQTDIRVYGNTAIVAFKLVATIKSSGESSHIYYFNTGTFLKRNGTWQATAWQATKIPPKSE